MNIIPNLKQLFKQKPPVVLETYLSLVLDESYVQAATFTLEKNTPPQVQSVASEHMPAPTWEDRLEMADKVISIVEKETNGQLSKVVFGLGTKFLTTTGEIEKSVRPHLKTMTKKLLLTPIGFVPITSAIVQYLKKAEGVPPSVIMLQLSRDTVHVAIYRVGRLSSEMNIERTENVAENIAEVFKTCAEEEVLPSHMLLCGPDEKDIEEVKNVLLRHQWTTQANFLHFPKIDVFPFTELGKAVADATASEFGVDEEPVVEEHIVSKETKTEEEESPSEEIQKDNKEESEAPASKTHHPSHMVVVQPESLGFHPSDEEAGKETAAPWEQDIFEKGKTTDEEDMIIGPNEEEEVVREDTEKKSSSFGGWKHSRFSSMSPLDIVKRIVKKILRHKALAFIAIPVVLVIAGIWYLTSVVLPQATVTVLLLPKEISAKDTVSIDQTATEVAKEKKIIPGRKIEKEVTGEKTAASTGKKKIGEAAKGTVTLYNKSLSLQTLKKGTTVHSGNLKFSFSEDVQIASASENLANSTRTYGKANAGVTADIIGPEGNVAANSEFTVKDISVDTLSGRNDQAFSGGTSKEVVVVSRTDYDSLLKSLTSDLIEKAKAELAQSVEGKEQLVDPTIKTAVKEKQFIEEIDQEAKELHGKLTVVVTAVSFSQHDVETFLAETIQSSVPTGYAIKNDTKKVTIDSVKVAKDGKMTVGANLTASAFPGFSKETILPNIVGKKLTDVEGYLRTLEGVAGVEFSFKNTSQKDRLPTKAANITVVIATQR